MTKLDGQDKNHNLKGTRYLANCKRWTQYSTITSTCKRAKMKHNQSKEKKDDI